MFYHHRRWVRALSLLLLGFVLSLFLHTWPIEQIAPPSMAQSIPLSALIQQGLQRYQAGDYAGAIAPWQTALSQAADPKDRAILHNNLAQAYRQIGQPNQAIAQWATAIQIYNALDTEESRRALTPLLIEQAQAYSELGQHRQAITLLERAFSSARAQKNPAIEAAAQGSLGSAYSALGDYEQALKAYKISLDLAQSINNSDYIATALNNLGNLYVRQAERLRFQANSARLAGDTAEATQLSQQAEQSLATAQQRYEQNWQISQKLGQLAEATALLNLNRLLEQSALSTHREQIAQYRSRVLSLLMQEPHSRPKAYALIHLARSLQTYPLNAQDTEQSQGILEQALTVARTIGDRRAESYALGSLGRMNEIAGRWREAMTWTHQAQFAAQQVNASESLYLWQWQAGRLYKAMGSQQSAITAYDQAIATLQSIRGDIVAANKDFQLNFRDAVELVYRELMALLLSGDAKTASRNRIQPIAPASEPDVKLKAQPSSASKIEKVLNILELLKLAEIQNFFGDECVQLARTKADKEASLRDPQAAIVYTVILDDHTEIILKAANGALTHYPIALTVEQIQQEIDRFRNLLEKRSTDEYLPQAQKIYQLLIRPLEPDLASLAPKTLVFINDGVLRNVPMAALHDGKQFLIQKYAIATTPSLNLTSGGSSRRDNLQALILGLTVERSPFAPLPNVEAETAGVQKILGGTRLLDQTFTLPNLQAQLQKRSYPIVHMATHGKFGADANSTFLLAFDDRIRIEQIDMLLRIRQTTASVELLTLSACQTAAGDNRTALGMAGVAVRAGVKSALATLWYINDEATVPLIEAFYAQLRQPNVSKAEALRNAQLTLIDNLDYNHPAVWSPFILVGNWL